MRKLVLVGLLLAGLVQAMANPICWYRCAYDNRLISETGRVNRDITLLSMKENNELPLIIVGGDLITFARYPKRLNKPLYLFNEISAELQNFRFNLMVNPTDDVFFAMNYQVNEKQLLDAFVTIGNLNKSPFYLTVGRQYLSYGDFNKYDVEPNPLTKSMFRIIEEAVGVGYKKGPSHIKIMATKDTGRYGLAYEHRFGQRRHDVIIGTGYITHVKNSNKALTRLVVDKNTQAMSTYVMINRDKHSLRAELSNAIGKIEGINNVSAYDLEWLYRFTFRNKPTKFILSTSGVFPRELKHNEDFRSLGLFTRQYVLSVKHQIFPHTTIGGALILGVNESVHRQAAMNLVVKF